MWIEKTDFRWGKETSAAAQTNRRRYSGQDKDRPSCPSPAAGTKEPGKAVCPLVTALVAEPRA